MNAYVRVEMIEPTELGSTPKAPVKTIQADAKWIGPAVIITGGIVTLTWVTFLIWLPIHALGIL